MPQCGQGIPPFPVGIERNPFALPWHLNARKEIAMLEIVVAVVIGSILVVGPLAWRVQRDRSESRALATRAYVPSLVDRQLGGGAFVSVQGTPRSLWSAGPVGVSVPRGLGWMVAG